MKFVGREQYLARLSHDLTDVALTGEGRFVIMRGRRRVGKSRLIDEFLRREQPASVFFTASRQSPQRELELFSEELARSDLPASTVVRADGGVRSWDAALSLVAATTQPDQPTVVVIDEFPFLLEQDESLEGTFQKLWDRELQSRPIMLVLIGSDLAMMETLTEYGSPLYGRPTRVMSVAPFSPGELAEMLAFDARDTLDAYQVIGGFPLIAQSWRVGQDLWDFLRTSLEDPTSPLIVDGERSLAAEFPASLQARRVLEAIGHGERTFTAIGATAGLSQTSLQRALDLLVEKRVVTRSSPLPSRSTKERRYVVSDPYLRFWLKFIGPHLGELERGRSQAVLEQIRSAWPTYRGRAIEPLVRSAIERLLSDIGLPPSAKVGGFWTRGNDVEVDIVVAEGAATLAIGSIKWRESKLFGLRDRDELVRSSTAVPGTTGRTKLIGVSRSGFEVEGLDHRLDPSDLMAAWRSPSEGLGDG